MLPTYCLLWDQNMLELETQLINLLMVIYNIAIQYYEFSNCQQY